MPSETMLGARSARKPGVGEVLSIVPNPRCVVFNMVGKVYGARNGAGPRRGALTGRIRE